jgi:hypothetical protein
VTDAAPDARPQGPPAGPIDDGGGVEKVATVIDLKNNVVAGASICVLEHAEIPCRTTAADGTTDLDGLPPINLTFDVKKGDIELLYAVDGETVAATPLGSFRFVLDRLPQPDADAGDAGDADGGTTLDSTETNVVFVPAPEGSSLMNSVRFDVTMNPESGSRIDGPFYVAFGGATVGDFFATFTPRSTGGGLGTTSCRPMTGVGGFPKGLPLGQTSAHAYAGKTLILPVKCL